LPFALQLAARLLEQWNVPSRIRIDDLWLTTRKTEKKGYPVSKHNCIDFGVDLPLLESHACPALTMRVETKLLRLCRAVEVGDDIDGWKVCWLGGWDKCRVLFVVMVKRLTEVPDTNPMCRRTRS
jgi:hypothetical protein